MSTIHKERTYMPLRAVLFDLDGLLINSEVLSQRNCLDVCREMGYAVDESVTRRMLGATVAECRRILREAVPDVDEDAYAIRVRERLFELFRRELKPMPGAEDILSFLSERRIPFALATSSARERVELSLSVTGLNRFFSTVLTGECAARSKPAPDLFLAAAEALHTPPKNCLVFEDSINGVHAGHAAGCMVCMVPDIMPYTETLSEDCDFLLQSLREAPALVRKLTDSTEKG